MLKMGQSRGSQTLFTSSMRGPSRFRVSENWWGRDSFGGIRITEGTFLTKKKGRTFLAKETQGKGLDFEQIFTS